MGIAKKLGINLIKVTLVIFSSLAVLSSQARAAWVWEVPIAGVPLSCVAVDGQRVPITISDDAIRLGGGAFAFRERGRTGIILSPSYLNSVPPLAATFIFYHECAHLALPFGVGLGTPRQEANADCYAAKKMVAHGFIYDDRSLYEALSDLQGKAGSNRGHMPGWQRSRAAARCASAVGQRRRSRPPSENGSLIYFRNKCRHPVSIAIRYRNTAGNWVSDGWWKFGGKKSGYLKKSRRRKVSTNNSIIYYYAEGIRTRNQWAGDYNKRLGRKVLPMRRKKLKKDSDGDYVLSLSCR